MKFVYACLFIGLWYMAVASNDKPGNYFFPQRTFVNKPEPVHSTWWIDSDKGLRPGGVR